MVKILGNGPAWKSYQSLAARLFQITIPLAMPGGVFQKSCSEKSTMMKSFWSKLQFY